MKFRLNCKEVSRLISEGLDHRLAGADRARMQLHFAMCQNCRNVDEQMGFLRRAMQQIDRESDDAPPSTRGA